MWKGKVVVGKGRQGKGEGGMGHWGKGNKWWEGKGGGGGKGKLGMPPNWGKEWGECSVCVAGGKGGSSRQSGV